MSPPTDPLEEITEALRHHFEVQAGRAVLVEDTTAGAVVVIDLSPPPGEVRVDAHPESRLVLARFDRCGTLVNRDTARAAAASYAAVLRQRYVEVAMGGAT